MATFDANSVEIEVIHDGAKPAVKVFPTRVVCHLTKGYTADKDTETIDPAVSINGRIKVTGTEKDWTDWRFAFLQLHKIDQMGFWYAGKNSADGGIAIVVNKPPALDKTLCLDSEQAFSPWTRSDEHYVMDGKARNFSTDHPALRGKIDLVNRARQRPNYLFHIVDRRELWTVFTVLNPQKKYQHLAFVHWVLEYNFKFKWRNGEPQVFENGSSLSFDKFEKGAPTDAALKSMLDNPGPPLANDLTREGMKAAVIGGPPNRQDLEKRFGNVPGDFYT